VKKSETQVLGVAVAARAVAAATVVRVTSLVSVRVALG
jgi:hypothetical protein